MSAKEFQDFFSKRFNKKRGAGVRLPKLHGPNRTEADYMQRLKSEFAGTGFLVEYECITFRLVGGAKYTPDFTVWDGARIVLAVEVKGPHIHNSRSVLAFKSARGKWPEINWRFAQKKNSGWEIKQ